MDGEKITCECDHCHEVKECVYADDPKLSELYGDDEGYESSFSFWCDECYSNRHDEV